jgi:hypothetical protein
MYTAGNTDFVKAQASSQHFAWQLTAVEIHMFTAS